MKQTGVWIHGKPTHVPEGMILLVHYGDIILDYVPGPTWYGYSPAPEYREEHKLQCEYEWKSAKAYMLIPEKDW